LLRAFIGKISDPHTVCICWRYFDRGFALSGCKVRHVTLSKEVENERGWRMRKLGSGLRAFVWGKNQRGQRDSFFAMKQRRRKFSRLPTNILPGDFRSWLKLNLDLGSNTISNILVFNIFKIEYRYFSIVKIALLEVKYRFES